MTTAAWLALATPARLHATKFTFDYDEDSSPSFDPDGSKLKAIVTAAGQIWADFIDAKTLLPGSNQLVEANYHFDLRWENLDGTTLGEHQPEVPIFDSRDLVFDTKDPNGNLRNWFFDPTPFDNSEFAMTQTLIRDLSPQQADDAYSGATSQLGLLEAGFNGFAVDPAAVGKIDLLTSVLHEMGHMLGFNWNPADDDYDMPSWAIGGHSLGVNEVNDMHGGARPSLMFHQLGDSERRLPSATDILSLADEGLPMTFDVPRQDFLGQHSNDWQDTLNWVGGAVPDADNQVFVRHGGSAMMATDGTAASLLVNDGSQVFVNNHSFRVFGATTLGSNFGPQGRLHVGTLLPGPSRFETESLALRSGIVNLQNNEAVLRVNRDLNVNILGTLMGAGRVEIGGTLLNNGSIDAGAFLLFGFGGDLRLATTGSGKLDLDGNGFIEGGRIAAVSGNLHVLGPLADDFNGTAVVGAGRSMNFSRPWKMLGDLEFRGGQTAAQAATLGGAGALTLNGQTTVDGLGVIAAPLTVNSASLIHVPDANDQITFAGRTTIRGGTFDGAGSFAVTGRTMVHLANPILPEESPTTNDFSFRMISIGSLDGGILEDPIVLDGSFGGGVNPDVLDGVLDVELQEADGVTTVFPTTYSFGVPVYVKTGGTLLAYGSAIHLPRPTTMAGGRLGGLHTVNQVGDLNVEQSSIINPTTFLWGDQATNHRTTLRSGARLDLTPRRIVLSGTDNVYKGAITMEAASHLHVDLLDSTSWRLAGSLTMSPGAVVSGDDLVNTGRVSGNGSFQMSRFENSGTVAPGRTFGGLQMLGASFVQTPGGVLEAVLGQSGLGNGTSLLTAGTAQLGGTLALSLANGFVPTVGTEFDLLKATSISGLFGNLSLSGPLGSMFTGELLYLPTRVAYRITGTTITADFNKDGAVDGADLAYWQGAMSGKLVRSTTVVADANGDGVADGADVLAWQRQLGHGVGRSLPVSRLGVAAVPEPASFALAIAALAGLAAGRKS
jgi:hypothetical protein